MKFGVKRNGAPIPHSLPRMDEYHKAVLVKEAIDGLGVVSDKRYIDATLGGGGHLEEIIRRGGIVLGIDTDREAVEFVRQKVEKKQATLVQGNFRDIETIARSHGFDHVDGILFDLGVSSHQLDMPQRGFSYRFGDAPLDLRLNQSEGETAASLLQRLSEEELYEIFAHFGEEERARPIARAICRARAIKPIRSVGQLVSIVQAVVVDQRLQPAVLSRIFQALRIAVNDEIGALKAGLEGSRKLLGKGGRLAVISFHSLEDRMVKRFFQREDWNTLTKKPIVARDIEVEQNRRARSAKLRIAEKL